MARPIEFDRERVLEQAMVCFWRSGYEATSIADLVAATRLKPGSLYAAFKNKQNLFLLTLERYAQQSLKRIEQRFTEAPDALTGIERFMHQLGQDCRNDDEGKGCLLVNSLLEFASADPEVHQQVRLYLDRVELLLREQVQRAMDAGQLGPGRTAAERATLLLAGVWGMRVMSARRPEARSYGCVAEQLLEAIR
ncbi:TetR/AcrR family transcriptional regulator [Aestuariirhabdus litorea]|uniref:TetR/AcrR family transcriptional regulator n=1 Tax=Aestuariirhabdus litorea TaxID=2528527 RepID=A0A3P3VKR8_9GAMM|nr:TetR/AcrR family transcriptional regulator [Aestuariirhabdus litorea]RRJ82468.1 TetR/AcrR family transcriptional regulator [Aestuariirhabdus litorea]RWW92629.1 TetR family transcriptional regulator [Endozoicomonadaceae bacterium GTF-13]